MGTVLIYLLGALITSITLYRRSDWDLEDAVVTGLFWFVVMPYLGLRWATKKISDYIDVLTKVSSETSTEFFMKENEKDVKRPRE